MAYRTPRSISSFCRSHLPLFHKETDGQRMLNAVKEILETDRWNSFDRFHDTTCTMVRHYESAGAGAEVYPVPTGGRIGSGRWIVHEAADVRSATVDVIRPVRQRVLDYRENPWHVAQWSAATPDKGMVNDLVVVDTQEELDRVSASGLAGKMVLTCLDLRSHFKTFAGKGAVGVICDRPVGGLPDATHWTKFGWGGIALENAAVRLVGLVLSENGGKALRKLIERHGRLTVRTRVDVRRYVGTHDLVSGVITGGADPQDEVWVLAHSAEPGALDNASGMAVCLEIARVIEGLAARGEIPRPRRTIRLLCGYECYSFFHYVEHTRRFQTPLAGACVDTLGARPDVCDGQLSWRATIPMSSGFVDRVGAAIIRSALRQGRSGCRLVTGPFVSTSDTLLGEPKYGFPCPWLTTHYRKKGKLWAAYHTSADTPDLLSPQELSASAAAMAGYLYYLADAGSTEVVQLARAETDWMLTRLAGETSAEKADYLREQHRTSIGRLQRWMWGGDRSAVLAHLAECERRVCEAGPKATPARRRSRPGGNRIPYRHGPISPTLENTPPHIVQKIRKAGLPPWALFWADGNRTLSDIARAVSAEQGKEISVDQVIGFFEAHAELGYVKLVDAGDRMTGSGVVADLKALGVAPGMDVMVHSSLSKMGYVAGGAEAVVDAILRAVGKRGTVLMPSFNHRRAHAFNPLATPTSNGAIADAFWRRPEAVRTQHPTHALAAIGPKAADLCRDHIETGLWTQDSPLARFIHGGGYILSIGVTHTASTAYHVGEVSVPCGCINPHGHVDRVVMPDGSVQDVPGFAFRSQPCPVPTEKLSETLNRRKLQLHGKVGHAPSTLVKAIEVWKARREHLKDVCPTCQIKPRMGGKRLKTP